MGYFDTSHQFNLNTPYRYDSVVQKSMVLGCFSKHQNWQRRHICTCTVYDVPTPASDLLNIWWSIGEPKLKFARRRHGKRRYLMSFLLVSPVTGGEGIAQPIGYGPGLDGQLQVEVLPLVDELLGIHTHLLHSTGSRSLVLYQFSYPKSIKCTDCTLYRTRATTCR